MGDTDNSFEGLAVGVMEGFLDGILLEVGTAVFGGEA